MRTLVLLVKPRKCLDEIGKTREYCTAWVFVKQQEQTLFIDLPERNRQDFLDFRKEFQYNSKLTKSNFMKTVMDKLTHKNNNPQYSYRPAFLQRNNFIPWHEEMLSGKVGYDFLRHVTRVLGALREYHGLVAAHEGEVGLEHCILPHFKRNLIFEARKYSSTYRASCPRWGERMSRGLSRDCWNPRPRASKTRAHKCCLTNV